METKEPSANTTERICEFYLQPRGCIKGVSCDFKHPLSPIGTVTNKVCEYFLKPRGCTKGQQCDFLHPDLEANTRLSNLVHSQAKNSVCSFFGQPRGCIKGETCDFLHPGQPTKGSGGSSGMVQMGGMHMGMGSMMGSMNPMGMGGGLMGGGNGPRVCEFFLQPRGCIKGNACNFAHIPPQASQYFGMQGMQGMGMNMMGRPGMTSAGPVNKIGKLLKPKVCEFFNSPNGCKKLETCEFVHQKQKMCEFANSARGCRKGKFCDFMHEPPATESDGGETGKVSKENPSYRYAPY